MLRILRNWSIFLVCVFLLAVVETAAEMATGCPVREGPYGRLGKLFYDVTQSLCTIATLLLANRYIVNIFGR